MKKRPQTIQIFLPAGEPQGIRVAELTTRIVQVIDVPRSLLGEFFQMPEAQQVAVYFLVGENGAGEPSVYIGQTGDLRTRFKDHDKKKEFWERALVLVSKTNSLTQTHALFLEWFSLGQVAGAGRFRTENGTAGSKPFTPPPLEADCYEIFETAKTLVGSIGYPLFSSFAETAGEDDDTFFCSRSGAEAKGLYTPEGFVVLKGAKARIEEVASIGESGSKMRRRLLDSGVMVEENGIYVFQKDHAFPSPSSAAMAVMGRTANGWVEWTDANGRTLDEVKRQNTEPNNANGLDL